MAGVAGERFERLRNRIISCQGEPKVSCSAKTERRLIEPVECGFKQALSKRPIKARCFAAIPFIGFRDRGFERIVFREAEGALVDRAGFEPA